MNYRFRYKPQNNKSFSEKKNKILSDFLFNLYRSKWYNSLGFGGDYMIEKYSKHEHDLNDIKNEIKYKGLEVENIIFYDLIRIEDSKKFKKQITKISSNFHPNFLQENHKKAFDNTFKNIDNQYDTISYGFTYHGKLKVKEKTDFIKDISIGYIKGSESTIIIKYKIYPTEKFNKVLTQCLEANISTESEIVDVSLKAFFSRTKKYKSGVSIKYLDQKYYTNKLFDEINYQLKFHIFKDLNVGVFMSKKHILFPKIITFEYDKSKIKKFEEHLHINLSSKFRKGYIFNETQFFIDDNNEEKSNYQVSILLPKRTYEEQDNGFNSVEYISENYSNVILPKLALINYANLQKDAIIDFRRKIFNHLNRNRSTLFLTKIIKLKNRLTISIIDFERFCKDLTGDNGISKRLFSQENNFPEAIRKCHNENCKKQHEFKKELFADCDSLEKNIKKTYDELSSLFQTISEDNHSRSNMRLQRLLFWIAILGILLTLYGANTQWCNSWLEYFLNKIGLSIPHVK